MLARLLRQLRIRRRLAASLKPAPEYRVRRLRQLSPERRTRYLANIEAIGLADAAEIARPTKGL